MPFVGNGCLGRRRERFVEVVCSGEMLVVFFNCSLVFQLLPKLVGSGLRAQEGYNRVGGKQK